VTDVGVQSLSPISPQEGLSSQALEEIRRAIIEGRLPAGSLTSVRALSDALSMSRTPVREALVDLANAGMVTFERNRGVRINDTEGHDIKEIFEIRLMLEVPAMRRAVPRFTPADVRRLGAELQAMTEHLDDEPSFMRHDRAFHRVPLEVANNGRLVSIVESLRDQTRVRGISTVGRSRTLRAIVAEHKEIHRVVRSGDPDAAADAMERHLLSTYDHLCSQMDDATPLERPEGAKR
jgi:DNA-binding GntR family transcriptional regulator